MEARRRLATGEAFKGTAWGGGGKDGMPRISSGTSRRRRSLRGELARDFNARISNGAFKPPRLLKAF